MWMGREPMDGAIGRGPITASFNPKIDGPRPCEDSERDIHGDPPPEDELLDAYGNSRTSLVAPWLSGSREG